MPFLALPVGPLELGIILAIIVALFGAERLTGIGGSIGRSIREFRREVKEGDEEPGQEQEKEKAKVEATKADIAWGNQSRSYVFQPYTMVNDHRTELKVTDVQSVMDGDLDQFIHAYLKRYGGKAA